MSKESKQKIRRLTERAIEKIDYDGNLEICVGSFRSSIDIVSLLSEDQISELLETIKGYLEDLIEDIDSSEED